MTVAILGRTILGMTSVDTAEEVWTVDAIIGTNVHNILWRRRIVQREFARNLRISDSVLSKRLRGQSAWSAQDLVDVANLLGVEPSKLLEQPTVAKFPQQVPPFSDEMGVPGVRRSLRVVRDLDPHTS